MKIAGVVCAGLLIASPAAAVTRISSPDAAYLAATTRLDITASDFDLVSSLTDADLSVTFDPSQARTVGVTWLSWGAPPETEDEFPRVLFADGLHQLTFNFSKLVSIFGFEAEPDGQTSHFTVDYYRAGALQGSIGADIDPFFAARLLAGQGAFDKVVVTSSDDVFAFGDVRYALSNGIPEPDTWAMMILGFGAAGAVLRRRRPLTAI